MSFPPKSQLWHCGIARSAIDQFISNSRDDQKADQLVRSEIVWLPLPGAWRYIADPFGLWRGGELFVFVEAYDYLTKKGTIHRYTFDSSLGLIEQAPCLEESMHLSYPFLIEYSGEVFMLPEQSRSGQLALYRAKRFPDRWERECVLFENLPVVDPSVIEHEGLWWMFFSIAGDRQRDRRELHVASAKELAGPWKIHPLSPIIDNLHYGRPGGTPWKQLDGSIIVPLQDCSTSYGGGLNFARVTRLDRERIDIEPMNSRLDATVFSDEWKDGTHTLSRCGDVTLFDAKKYFYSFGRYKIDIQRQLRRFFD